MTKLDPKNQASFEFDEKGTKEVSEQIMDAYNSGFIDQGLTAQVDSEEVQGTEG